MMNIAPYQISDYSFICKWLEMRSLPLWEESILPKMGFTVSDEHGPVAIGFLRRCEGNWALIDAVVTNPQSSSDKRHVAYDTLVERLINEAKVLEISALLAFTTDDGTFNRSKTHGFECLPHVVISRNLKDGNNLWLS